MINNATANARMQAARETVCQWNSEREYVPWEWVEETLIAWIKIQYARDRQQVSPLLATIEQYHRFQEYADRIPAELREELLPDEEEWEAREE